ncbi:PREDICTED: uncharacterized protein LOC105823722, partial [Propithecus coquereli]
MAAAGAGSGPGAPPGLEATRQKLALRRKKVLSAEEMELYELAQAAGGAIDPDVFKILVDLLKLNVAPLAVFQMLKSMCAGQRLASEPQDPAAVSLPAASVSETRGQSWAGRGGREGGRFQQLAWCSSQLPAMARGLPSASSLARFCQKLNRLKPLEESTMETSLRRCLSTLDLTLLGVGGMVGSGLYVLTGTVAKNLAVLLSFGIAAVASLLAAL